MRRGLWVLMAGCGLVSPPARADVLVIPPQRRLRCVIELETDAEYQVRTPQGTTAIRKRDVRHLERAPVEANRKLLEEWGADAEAYIPMPSPEERVTYGLVIPASDVEFDRVVLHSKGLVMVEFTAGEKRNPDQGTVSKKLAREFRRWIACVRVHTEHCPLVQQRYQIETYPYVMLFLGGKPVEYLAGFQPSHRLRTTLQSRLPGYLYEAGPPAAAPQGMISAPEEDPNATDDSPAPR